MELEFISMHELKIPNQYLMNMGIAFALIKVMMTTHAKRMILRL